jgi:hypothetical protein
VRSVPVAREVTPSENGARSATRRVIRPVALGVLLIVVWWWWWTLAIQSPTDDWAFDFRQFWQGAKDVVDGVSPYPSSALVATATDRLDPEGIREVFRFPYPAGAAVSLAPLGLLGFHTAAAVWSALLIVSLLGGVWLLGVRDWRVLAVVVTSAPVISSVRLGTFTPLLVLALAIGLDGWYRASLSGLRSLSSSSSGHLPSGSRRRVAGSKQPSRPYSLRASRWEPGRRLASMACRSILSCFAAWQTWSPTADTRSSRSESS